MIVSEVKNNESKKKVIFEKDFLTFKKKILMNDQKDNVSTFHLSGCTSLRAKDVAFIWNFKAYSR